MQAVDRSFGQTLPHKSPPQYFSQPGTYLVSREFLEKNPNLEGRIYSLQGLCHDAIMQATLSFMNQAMQRWDRKSTIHYKCSYDTEGNKLTHSFLLDPDNICVIPETTSEQGTFKNVTPTVHLSPELPDWVCFTSPNPGYINYMVAEFQLLVRLHKLAEQGKIQGRQYIAPPACCRTAEYSQTGRYWIPSFFQKRFLCNGSALLNYSLSQIAHVFQCVAWGLHVLHQLGYVHGDIKLSNIGLSREDEPKANQVCGILIDFGSSCKIGSQETRATLSSPEELEMCIARFTAKVQNADKKQNGDEEQNVNEVQKTAEQDIFALGITILSCFCSLLDDDRCKKDDELYRQYASHPISHILKSTQKWAILIFYLYTTGVTDDFKCLVRRTLFTHPFGYPSDEEEQENINPFLEIAFLLLEKDPSKRPSAEQTAEKFRRLEETLNRYKKSLDGLFLSV